MSSSSKLLDIVLAKRISAATMADMQICLQEDGELIGSYDASWATRVPPVIYPRLVFPLRNLYGSVRGIAYRSELLKFSYEKTLPVKPSEMLYGLHLTHEYIRTAGYAIIVEGVFDFLRLYDVGVRNVVSTLGARLSWTQMCLLARFCCKVVICYDPDAAGRSATDKAIVTLHKGGILPAPVYLTDDPDDFVNKYGTGRFIELCSQSLNGIDELPPIRS